MTEPAPKVYRKRRAGGVILRAAVIDLAALLLLAVLLFFGLRKYIAYSDTGRLYLDIPWLAGYMDGRPEDDPLSSELTLTGDSYRSEQPSAEPDGQEPESLPGPSGENASPEHGEAAEEEPAVPPSGTPDS